MEAKPHQPALTGSHETIDDALHDLVMALEGYKKVGAKLWPEKSAEDAGRLLRHCLTTERREKLSPQQLLLLLRWGKERNHHGAKYFIDDDTGYNRGAPVDPKIERDKAIEAVESAAAALARATVALERASAGIRPELAVVPGKPA